MIPRSPRLAPPLQIASILFTLLFSTAVSSADPDSPAGDAEPAPTDSDPTSEVIGSTVQDELLPPSPPPPPAPQGPGGRPSPSSPPLIVPAAPPPKPHPRFEIGFGLTSSLLRLTRNDIDANEQVTGTLTRGLTLYALFYPVRKVAIVGEAW